MERRNSKPREKEYNETVISVNRVTKLPKVDVVFVLQQLLQLEMEKVKLALELVKQMKFKTLSKKQFKMQLTESLRLT